MADRPTETLPRPDGVDIHYVTAGQGPTVLLAHGYLLDHHLYDGLLEPLSERGLRAVAFDQRGHGRSGINPDRDDANTWADDYAALITHLSGAGPLTLVAHSMGAFLALLACLRHRELFQAHVGQLVLLGGNAGNVAAGSIANRLQIPLLRVGLMPRMWRVPPLGRALMRPLFGDSVTAAQLEWTRKTVTSNNPKRSLRVLSAMTHEDLYPRLGEIPIATHVVCGTRDQTCPPWHSERLGKAIPDSHTTWLSRCGHMLPLEDPDAVLLAIDAAATAAINPATGQ